MDEKRKLSRRGFVGAATGAAAAEPRAVVARRLGPRARRRGG